MNRDIFRPIAIWLRTMWTSSCLWVTISTNRPGAISSYVGTRVRTLHARGVPQPPPRNIAADPDLQRMHALVPWLVTWDDHEVDNDYANDQSEHLDPQFLIRRAAAYQAYYEHMPLRHSAGRAGRPPAAL